MEKIKVGLPERAAGSNDDYIANLASSTAVQAKLKQLKAGPQDLARWPLLFADYAKTAEKCSQCKGLEECVCQPEGYPMDIVMHQNCPVEVRRPCRYYRTRYSQTAHYKNYTVCDLTPEGLQRDISSIDLAAEKDASYISTVNLIKQWLAHPARQGLYLYGPMGVGKSYLASCLTNELTRQGVKVAFVNMPHFGRDARDNMSEKDYIESRLRAIRSARVAVFDDIGADYVTSWVRDELLFTTLDWRMEHRLATFFTSNCDFETLKTRLMYNQTGEKDEPKALRVMERIRTLSLPVMITGPDRR